jgi:hypothetical protein
LYSIGTRILDDDELLENDVDALPEQNVEKGDGAADVLAVGVPDRLARGREPVLALGA